MSDSEIHEFQVEMTCDGCSGAVRKVMGKLEGKGVNKVEIDMEKQRVYVDSSLSTEDLLESLNKTGKKVSYIGVKGN